MISEINVFTVFAAEVVSCLCPEHMQKVQK